MKLVGRGGGDLPQERLTPALVKRGRVACPLEAMQAWEMVISEVTGVVQIAPL